MCRNVVTANTILDKSIKNMIRTAASHLRSRVPFALSSTRSMITSAQKRALQKEQIDGKQVETVASPSSSEGIHPPNSAVEVSSSKSSGVLPIILLAAGGLGGGAYYMGMIPEEYIPKGLKGILPQKNMSLNTQLKVDELKEKRDSVASDKSAEKNISANTTPTTTSTTSESSPPPPKENIQAIESKKREDNFTANGNRVVQISAPSSVGRKSEILPIPDHPEKGNRVCVSLKPNSKEQEKIAPVPKIVVTVAAPNDVKSTLSDDELKVSALGPSIVDTELARAESIMKSALEQSLKGLDDLSPSELRTRVIQLVTEMGERTKWEAVRLKEFLYLKEKEVGEKYLEKMQKQRLEFEDLLARRLREQEGAITRAANQALEAQEKSIESVVNAAANAQKAEFEAAIKEAAERFDREYSAKYESEYGNKLADEKAAYIADLEQKLAMIEELSSRLQQAEKNLQLSRNFETGSQRAHRVSAAAMALAEKMESSNSAAEEYAALKAASVENGVIASALEKIPTSIKSGIPTVPELQAKFDQVYTVARRAAHVPSGRHGIEGQLAGFIFASLIVPPSFDTPPPQGTDDADQSKFSDYILSRARHHIQLGEIEEAIGELEKLQGQVAYTLSDFKEAALDRISVNKALKVIKMECALMNSSMGGK